MGVSRHTVISFALGLGLAVMAVLASRAVLEDSRRTVAEGTAQTASQAAYQIELLIGSRLGAGRHLQQLWREGAIATEAEFRREARSLVNIHSGIRSIAWLDGGGHYLWVEPEVSNTRIIGVNLRDIPGARDTFDHVAAEGVAASSPPFDFIEGGTGFVNLYPLDRSGRRAGYISVAFHTAAAIDRALGEEIPKRYHVQVHSDGRLVHEAGAEAAGRPFAGAHDFLILGRTWTITLWPTAATAAAQIGSAHVVILAVGLAASVIVALLLALFLSRHQALRASEAIAAALIDNVPSSLNTKSLDGRYLRVNRKFLEWARKPLDEVIGHTETEVHGDRGGMSEQIADHERQVLAEGAPVHRERFGLFNDGVYRHVLVSKFPITDGAGRITALGTTATDISEQKQAQEVLRRSRDELERLVGERTRELQREIRVREIAETSWRESEERLRDIAESASDWFWEMDANLCFTYISNRFFEIARLERTDVIGRSRWEFANSRLAGGDPGERADWARHKADLEAHRPFRDFEYTFKDRNGRDIAVRLSGRPVFDARGAFAGYRGAGTDVTTAHDAERLLVRAKEELERLVDERTKALRQEVAERRRAQELADQASRAKTDFLANVSHEFRTPLNGIIGFSEIIASEIFGPLGAPRYKEYAEDIIRSGRHLMALINDVLDVSRIEAGAMTLYEEPVNLALVVDQCVSMVDQRAEAKGVALTVAVPRDLPLLLADATRVRQILLNLLSNAVKFTEKGGAVRVDAGWSADAGHVLSVSDTGIGIDAKDIPKVLQPFGQADRAFTRAHEGFGLGLTLVQSLTEEHGGTLDIDSTPGKGTTVTVTFPPFRTVAEDAGAARGD